MTEPRPPEGPGGTSGKPRLKVGDSIPVVGVRTGRVVPYPPDGNRSAYRKQAVDGEVQITERGIEGDEQAEPEPGHGPPDNAIHHYPFDHYAAFAVERPDLVPVLSEQGAFAENLSSVGWTEWDVCIGDRFELGTAEVELSQGRSPCWKLGRHLGDPLMIDHVTRTRRAGWYYRVRRPGTFAAGGMITLIERPHPEWPVARAFGMVIAGERDEGALEELLEFPELGMSWQLRIERLLISMRRRR